VVGASFSNMDHWRGINTGSFDATHGFAILGARNHVELSRPRGQTKYTRFNINLSRLQSLGTRFSVYAGLHSQYSFEALLATEQFGIGGPDIGRGYDPSEIVGDKGISGKIELRLDANPDWNLLHSIQYYVFYDAGSLWNIDTLDFPSRQTATSTGVGARFNFVPQVTGNFYIAKPLDRPVSTLTLLQDNGTSARAFFQITATL
jgi:hemolysin activation/secretion protein